MSSQIRTGRHCVYSLQVHLVFITKYRRNVLTKEMLDRLGKIYQELCKSFDAELPGFIQFRTGVFTRNQVIGLL